MMMIQASKLTKRFDDIVAVDPRINATIKDSCVFGYISTNGAEVIHVPHLRLMSGVLKPEEGHVTIDGHGCSEHGGQRRFFIYRMSSSFSATPREDLRY